MIIIATTPLRLLASYALAGVIGGALVASASWSLKRKSASS